MVSFQSAAGPAVMVNGGRTNQGLTGSAGGCSRAGSSTGGLSRFDCCAAGSLDGSASDSVAESSSESAARAAGVARRALTATSSDQ